jgi:hypothetical protein
MLMNLPVVADFMLLKERRQLKIDQALLKANAQRVRHDYQPGQAVWMKTKDPWKLHRKWDGPFNVMRVHTNSNVTIQLRDHVTQRVNIRQLKPCKPEEA